MKTIVYRLRSIADNKFLKFEDHGDYTQIFSLCRWDDDVPASFEDEESALRAICDRFYFHHGCGAIPDTASAKDRLSMIQLVKVTIIQEEEIITPTVYIPTNIEIHNWYVAAKGDDGLRFYLKSQVPNWEEHSSWGTYYDDDGYDFAGDYFRIKEYNAWVAAGKPVKPSKSERIAKIREAAAKGEKIDD